MTKTQEDRIWRSSKEIIMDAYERIRKYQSGELLPARTGYDYLDKALLGGFYPQHAVAIGPDRAWVSLGWRKGSWLMS